MYLVLEYNGESCDLEIDERFDCSVDTLREQLLLGLKTIYGKDIPNPHQFFLYGPNSRHHCLSPTASLSSLHLQDWDTLYLMRKGS